MPNALSDKQIQIVKGLLELDVGDTEQNYIADKAGCSIRQVQRIKSNIIKYGNPRGPGKKKEKQRKICQEAGMVSGSYFSMNR
jgi:hypothetical protein